MTLIDTLKTLEVPLMADGRIDLGETTILLRAVRPYVLAGDKAAVELEALLKKVRQDGVITANESEQIRGKLGEIVYGEMNFSRFVREVRDFPRHGMTYRDLSAISGTPGILAAVVDEIGRKLAGVSYDIVVSPEPAGVVFGAAVAARFGKAFATAALPGRLPGEALTEARRGIFVNLPLTLATDAVLPGERVVIIDEVLASGGSAAALVRLVERLGGEVKKLVFPVELGGYGARENTLAGYAVDSVITYPGK